MEFEVLIVCARLHEQFLTVLCGFSANRGVMEAQPQMTEDSGPARGDGQQSEAQLQGGRVIRHFQLVAAVLDMRWREVGMQKSTLVAQDRVNKWQMLCIS